MLRHLLRKAGLFGWRYVEGKSMTVSDFVCTVATTIGRIVEEIAGINPEYTFGDINAELVSMDPVNLRDASILRAHYGPKPYWTRSEPTSRPEDTCQTLYAVANGESVPYILGVVRNFQSDYPIMIYNSGTNPTLTVCEAIVTAQPDLQNRIVMVTEYSGDLDVRMDPLEFERRVTATRLSESFPTVFFVTTREASGGFLHIAPSTPIPPLLQTTLVHCEHLLRRVSNVPTFRAQATHVLHAILHIIFAFSDKLQPLFHENNPGIESAFVSDGSLAELLPVAPQLARQIANILNCVENVIRALEATDGDQDKTKSALDQALLNLCGDFPGAVAVRQSCAVFRALDSLNDDAPLQIEGNNITSELWVPSREALHAEKAALGTIRSNLGDNHLDTARAMLRLASGYSVAGRYSKAEDLQVKGLKILQSQLGEMHPDTLFGMLNLSCIYNARGRYKQAASLQIIVLQLRTQQLGDEHVDTHRTRLCLGTTYFRQSRYSEAKPLQIVAVEGLKTALGQMHEDTLIATGELALTYNVLSLYSMAETLQTMAIRGLVNTLGESHISTYKAELNLALMHYRHGRYAEAKALQEKASEVFSARLGETHPDTLFAKRDLSLTFSTVGVYDKAERLQKEVLEGLKTTLGPSHPDTRITDLYLATTYFRQGQYSDAKLLQTDAFTSLKAELGGVHTATLSAMRDLALTHCAQGDYKEAIELQERVGVGLGHMLGPGHPDTIIAKRDLGITYGAKGDLNKAASFQRTALQGLREHLGETHPETLITMLNLVALYSALNHHPDAQSLQSEVLVSLKPEGMHHVGILSALYKLTPSYKRSREGRHSVKTGKGQKDETPKGPPTYSLAELLEMLNASDDKPDSDVDMDDGDDSSNDGDGILNVDMDKDIY